MTIGYMLDIKEKRVAAGLSQTELGRLTGLNQATISRIERGRQEPSLSQLQRIADACGYELDMRPKRRRSAA